MRSRARAARPELGFSLLEAVAATAIAVIAVLGLAYSFGLGRGYIDRFQIERSADLLAQRRMEILAAIPLRSDSAFALGDHSSPDGVFYWNGAVIGAETWRVAGAPPSVPQRALLREVTVTVRWTAGGFPDSVAYRRVFAL